MNDTIYRKDAIDAINALHEKSNAWLDSAVDAVMSLPSVQQEYEPVTAEDFAKIMSESTILQYATWYGMALALMKGMGFEICKKTM